MPTEPVLHSLAISQVIINFAASYKVDIETCLEGTQISQENLRDADALIRPEQEMRLIENLIMALPSVPALGFELGTQYNVSTFGTWGFAIRTCRNLREAVEKSIRYMPLSTAYVEYDARVENDEYIITADPGDIPPNIRQFLLERDLSTAVTVLRELNLTGQPVQRLEFTGPAPDHAARIRELAAIPVSYGAKRNALVMKLEDVQTPLPTFDDQLTRLLEDQCRQLMQRRQIDGVAGQVRQRLLGNLGLIATLNEVAKDMNMSPRSLHRKLEAENSSFREIVEEARQQLASQLLETTDMKLDEMAIQLGYADRPSFTRAFQRWHSMSPSQYRTDRN